MSVEQFLRFWSQYNVLIIELVIGAILVMTVYIAYRTFFGPEAEEGHGAAGGAALDVGALEKTLQKFLENQPAPGASAAGGAPASGEDLDKLKLELAEKDRLLEELKNKPAAVAAEGAPAADDEEKKKLGDRVKDLEARLAEYEIISEDIADLSFYKEENGKLQKELEALRGGSAPAAAPSSAGSAPAAPAAPADGAAAAPAAPEPPAETPPAEGAATAEPAAATSTNEDLLREMASAATTTPPPANPDDSKLMNQFEDFVKKG